MPQTLHRPMTLPQHYYTDPERFRTEMERFFFGRWICAGRAERVSKPGDYFLCDVAGESVIVTRDSSGELRAFHNVCRHRGTQMCTEVEGSLPGGRIRCPYHAWTYALDGSLIGAPHMDEGFDRSEYTLHRVNVAEWDGHIFLHLGDAAPLAQQLGDLPAKFTPWRMGDLRMARRIVYDVRANWKLIVSNYNECLHCPVLHPSLNRLTNYMGADNQQPTPNYVGGSMGFRDGAQTMSTDGLLRRDYLPGLDETQRSMVAYYAIYPNFLLSLHPDYMMTHVLWPRAVDRTEIVCEFHFHPEEMAKPGFTIDDAIAFWDETNREDWHISELSQRGISSRAYTPGPYSRREELLAAFDRVIRGDRVVVGDE